MNTAEQTMTADELLKLPDGDHYELVDGILFEKDAGAFSGWVRGRMSSRFNRYADQHNGWAFGGGVGYRCFRDDPERVRKPDASYIRSERLPSVPDGFITIPPDVAVEVISPTDVVYEVEAKVEEYLDAGVKLVWLINPFNRSVRVFEGHQRPVQLGPSDELNGGDVLPGFQCSVRELFPPATHANA